MAERNKGLEKKIGGEGTAIKGAVTKTDLGPGNKLPLGHAFNPGADGYCRAFVAIMRDGRCGLGEGAH